MKLGFVDEIEIHGSRPRQRKYQPSLQEPKEKAQEEERGRRKLALWRWREKVNLSPIGFVSTIHKRFHGKIKIEIVEGREHFWFWRCEKADKIVTKTENGCDCWAEGCLNRLVRVLGFFLGKFRFVAFSKTCFIFSRVSDE